MRYLYASLAAAMLAAATVPAVAGTLLVPQQFSTIQAALNAAKPYDTVLVSAKPKGGVYNEALTINTPGIVLQGQGNPVIDGTGLGIPTPVSSGYSYTYLAYPNGINILASHVAVRGLTVQNTGDGGYYDRSTGIYAGYFSPDGGTTVMNSSDIEISSVTARRDTNGITVQGFGTRNADGTFTNPSGYRVLGCVVTGNTQNGASLSGVSDVVATDSRFANNGRTGLAVGGGFFPSGKNVLVSGNLFKNNTYDGVDVYGTNLLVSANESASNGTYGMLVDTRDTGGFVAAPITATTSSGTVTLNSVHDNSSYGLYISGAQTVVGNSLSRNTSYGLYLQNADYSTISLNAITGTAQSGSPFITDDGTGLFATSFNAGSRSIGFLTIFGNSISGNTGDGIYLLAITGSTVSYNTVSRNSEIGIHLSDFTSTGDAPITITQNQALHNGLFDARDDSSATDDVTYSNGDIFYGDSFPTIDFWTKNLFGTTDPVGLSK